MSCTRIEPDQRGGKYCHWEGGIRANAFVSGGFVPTAQRGTKSQAVMHVADWYATFCALAGVDPTDHTAAASGLPPVDSLDLWPTLSGANATSPRVEVFIDSTTLLQGDWKLLTGKQPGASWPGPQYPNATTETSPVYEAVQHCSAGCLYNVAEDPTEHEDVASQYPARVKSMSARLAELTKTIWQPAHEKNDPACMATAQSKYGGFYGPWMELDE